MCRKELDGWEPHENPWEEHAKRNCPFIKKGKKSRDLTVEDYFELEAERLCHIMVKEILIFFPFHSKNKWKTFLLLERQI